jgi:6-phosphogluconolactonase (cycloisomerase 2 family)
MSITPKLAVATGAAVAASALFPAVASAATVSSATHPAASHGVVFAQNDSPSGNQVIAYDRTAQGTLTQAGEYATGGVGGQLGGSVVDHLASEDSMAYDAAAHLLYTVNAGSDSITVFAVDGDRLTRLQVIGSGGTFPVSIAARDGVVYVLNALDGGSISGFLRIGRSLIEIPAWHRALGLDPDQTPEFTSTPGEIAFTPDGSHLVVTTKNGANSILTYGVGLFGPSAAPTVTSTPGDVPFGFGFDAAGQLVAAEAGPSAIATFGFGRAGRLTSLDSSPTGQAAACWTAVDGDIAYTSNAGSGSVSAYRIGADGGLTALGNTATDAGTVDAVVSPDGKQLYVETGAAGIIDTYDIGANGALTRTGGVTIPDGVGAEGIVVL